jgi:hypothetical protein
VYDRAEDGATVSLEPPAPTPAAPIALSHATAISAFENAVAEARRMNPRLDLVAAIQQVVRERPDLAAARNDALAAIR